MVPTIGDPHYDDYCDFVKATFCPVRGVVLPDMYLSRLLNKRFTTAKLEAASCGDLMKIFTALLYIIELGVRHIKSATTHAHGATQAASDLDLGISAWVVRVCASIT